MSNTTSRSTWVLGRQPNATFECVETDYDTRGDCDGPYGVGETATYAYGQQPRQAVELCRSHGQQAVATGQLVRWTEYDVQPPWEIAGPGHRTRQPHDCVLLDCPVWRAAQPAPAGTALQLAVTYHDDVTRYYPVPAGKAWRIDVTHRQIVIGRGVPRTMIPLDTVRAYAIERRGAGSGNG